MLRTRAAILSAAARCVERDGVRKTTMGDLAHTGGVAKATLYNHFRTKDDVLAALVDDRVAALAAECVAIAAGDLDPHPVPGLQTPDRGRGLAAALVHAAAGLASCRPLRRVAADEPALLLPLTVPGEGRGWLQARAAVGDVLVAAGLAAAPEAVDALLRWLVGQVLWPAAPAAAEHESMLLQGAFACVPAPQPVELAAVPDRVDGLGWPG